MVFPGRFKDLILPDRLHVLNVSFHVPELRRTSAAARRTSPSPALLGEEPIVLATVGADDFARYAAWLDEHGIRRDAHRRPRGRGDARSAYITTDLDDNQIIGFHPGAMERAHEAEIARRDRAVRARVSSRPNGKRAMQRARARAQAGAASRTLIDPGQGLPLFERDELIELIDGAELLFANDYEWSLTQERTGLGEAEIVRARRRSDRDARRAAARAFSSAAARRSRSRRCARARVVDPTGCGDAYRAAFAHGLARGLPLATCARMGSLLGALLVERHGTQIADARPGRVPRAHYAAGFRTSDDARMSAQAAAKDSNLRLDPLVRDRRAAARCLGCCRPCWAASSFVPEVAAPLAGLAIVGAAFLLSWATELAERDIPQALALLLLALVSRAARVRGRPHFAWKAGDESRATPTTRSRT